MLYGLLRNSLGQSRTRLKKGYLDSTMTVVEEEWNEENNEKAEETGIINCIHCKQEHFLHTCSKHPIILQTVYSSHVWGSLS